STWRSRIRSHLPYHPGPMRPTRLGLSRSDPATWTPAADTDRASPAAPAWRNSRRFMVDLRGAKVGERMRRFARPTLASRPARCDGLPTLLAVAAESPHQFLDNRPLRPDVTRELAAGAGPVAGEEGAEDGAVLAGHA